MPSKKHYILTAVTLGAIAGISAGLISLANLVTADRITKNEEARIDKGVDAIFGVGSKKEVYEKELKEFEKLDKSYKVIRNDVTTGWAIRATGSNMYGKISMIVGFDYETKQFLGTYLITNEQTYASTLVDNYVTPLNEGKRQLDDVSCGATYGATLVKDLVNAAQSYVNDVK